MRTYCAARPCQGGRQIGREGETRLRRARCETQPLECGPCCLDEASQRHLSIWCNIGRNDVQPLGEELRGPARADDSGTYDRDFLNWLVVGHIGSPFRVFRRMRRR